MNSTYLTPAMRGYLSKKCPSDQLKNEFGFVKRFYGWRVACGAFLFAAYICWPALATLLQSQSTP